MVIRAPTADAGLRVNSRAPTPYTERALVEQDKLSRRREALPRGRGPFRCGRGTMQRHRETMRRCRETMSRHHGAPKIAHEGLRTRGRRLDLPPAGPCSCTVGRRSDGDGLHTPARGTRRGAVMVSRRRDMVSMGREGRALRRARSPPLPRLPLAHLGFGVGFLQEEAELLVAGPDRFRDTVRRPSSAALGRAGNSAWVSRGRSASPCCVRSARGTGSTGVFPILLCGPHLRPRVRPTCAAHRAKALTS